jgi:hypothetical protein
MNVERLFNQFTEERRLLMNVTPKTLVWYKTSWVAFQAHLQGNLDEK